jgi:hypothetical protein
MHRTPSTPTLGGEYFGGADSTMNPASKESLAELWQNFLEQEASRSGSIKGGKSRTGSMSTVSTPRP